MDSYGAGSYDIRRPVARSHSFLLIFDRGFRSKMTTVFCDPAGNFATAARRNQREPARYHFGYFPQLDGFRGVSVALVLFAHSSIELLGPLGALGVMLFFVLSGFLITGLLCEEERRYGSISLRNFYGRRALRIFPAFYFFLIVMTLLISSRFVTDVPWYTMLVACLYLSNIFGRGISAGHLWSLSLEEQFYALWPPSLRALGKRRGLWLAAGIIVIINVWRVLAIQFQLFDYQQGIFYVRPWFRFDSILIGCCIALLLDLAPNRAELRPKVVRWAEPMFVLPLLFAWTLWAERVFALRPVYLTVQMFLAASVLLHLVVCTDSHPVRWLSHPILRFLGKISYSVYLWQQIFLATKVPSWGWIRVFPISLGCALLVGTASHYFIERPLLKLKDRFTQR